MYARNDVASVMSTRNDVKAAVLWRQIRQSMRIHSMNNPAIFHPDRIWNALCFFGRGRPNRISSEMVPDPKIPRPTVDTSRSPVPVPTNLSRSNWKKQVRMNCCIGVRKPLRVHSPGGSTVLREMTSWSPAWKYDVKSNIRLRQSMRVYLTNINANDGTF